MGEARDEIQTRADQAGISYSDGRQTGCPSQAYYDDGVTAGYWISVGVPPCKQKTCGHGGCHLFGKSFVPEHNRWATVPAALAGKGAK